MDLETMRQEAPRFATLLEHELEGVEAARRASVLERYEALPTNFFREAEAEIGLILGTEEGRTLSDCLEDLDAFNALTEETENDAWYDRRAAFVSMHLDFLLLGFSRRRLDTLLEHLSSSALPEGASLGEVGSGCGRLVALLLREHPGWSATLIDRSPAARGYAQAYLGLQSMGARTQVKRGDLLELPAEDAAFDAMIAAEVLEHTTDAEQSARELVRVLRPGGLLAISLPIDLDIGMHPVVFETPQDILDLFAAFPLEVVAQEMVEPIPGLDAICEVFPGFQGCFHVTFQKQRSG